MSIVVGYVPTREGRAALRKAAAEAQLRQATLVVVKSQRRGRDFDAEEARQFEELLGEVQEGLAAHGVEHEVRSPGGGDPSEDLIEIAEETGAELIVIGLRRRTPVGKLILGSNAQRILLDAPCPVLAVKADAETV